MIVKQIYADNRLRNFHYLIGCEKTKEAMIIDPLDVDRCMDMAQKNGFSITTILNTHDHWDHIGGNKEIKEKTGANILSHKGAMKNIPDVDKGLIAGDIITVGENVQFKILDTPGHTDSHICLLSCEPTPSLFCGDTMFNAGVGHCKLGGNPDDLYQTFSSQISTLSGNTLVYPGHDYMVNNLEFTLDREPNNKEAKKYLRKLEGQDPHRAFISTMNNEREINSFLRLNNETVINELRKVSPTISKTPSEKEVFIALRELRDNW
jgi:hydroxyacylglutathione hydrolase